ncbi:MAG: glycosyltransferase family 9 protein [Vicinamibacterales bacterium]
MTLRQEGREGKDGRERQEGREGKIGESRPTRFLLVRLRQIGDVVFSTPAVTALREDFLSAHITYLVEPAAAAVVEGHPAIDELIVAPRTRGIAGVASELDLVRRLRAGRFDVAIDFHGGPRASLLTWLSGAQVRIGYEVAGRAWMYTRRVERPRELRPRHSVENQWDLIAALGVPAPDRERYPVVMPVDPRAMHDVRARLARAGVADSDPVIVLHVSAGNPFRRWAVASFAEVAAALAAGDKRRRIVVTSGPSEAAAAGAVIEAARAALPEDARARVLVCGEFTLAELRALLERAVLYVGGDSGPMHIAATSRVPIVSLYGPTLPARSAPWRPSSFPSEAVETLGLPCRPCDQRVCEPGDFRCLGSIAPSQVLLAAERALARATG